jgi:hypothetical protein
MMRPILLLFLAMAPALPTAIHAADARSSSERDTIRTARDRKRSVRSAYLSRRLEWRKLAAETRCMKKFDDGFGRDVLPGSLRIKEIPIFSDST